MAASPPSADNVSHLRVSTQGRRGATVERVCSQRRTTRATVTRLLQSCLVFMLPIAAAQPVSGDDLNLWLTKWCGDCHQGSQPAAGVRLPELLQARPADKFFELQKVERQIRSQSMPPPDAEQPPAPSRERIVRQLQQLIQQRASQFQSDPGPAVLRRLTSAEYRYAVLDLTGIELPENLLEGTDATGAEGFTNAGTVQFIQPASLQRYLEAAQFVADRAVIASGPISFYQTPGRIGRELSAIQRIQTIYRTHGFRATAGEGGQPFGLHQFVDAFFCAWQFQHRAALGQPDVSLDTLARQNHVNPRFARHIYAALTKRAPLFPTVEVCRAWAAIPAPGRSQKNSLSQARTACEELFAQVQSLQRQFLLREQGREALIVPLEQAVALQSKGSLRVTAAVSDHADHLMLQISVKTADGRLTGTPRIDWKNAVVQLRHSDAAWSEPAPLLSLADGESVQLRLADSSKVDAENTVTQKDADVITTSGLLTSRLRLLLPRDVDVTAVRVAADVCLLATGQNECVVRCGLALSADAAEEPAASAWVLLADNQSSAYRKWRKGIAQFAELFPIASHSEPAPSDRDPIPSVFDNSYNVPERDQFHFRIKYYRNDSFLVRYMLNENARRQLDIAWNDLLGSFDYHDEFRQLLLRKYQIDDSRPLALIDEAWLKSAPKPVADEIRRLQESQRRVNRSHHKAEKLHPRQVANLAEMAWRTDLTPSQTQQLNEMYQQLRHIEKLNHADAIRGLLVHVLASPRFLFRVEHGSRQRFSDRSDANIVLLTDEELAARLSFLLWSSVPDKQLRRAASESRLTDTDELRRQVDRMLSDVRSRRFATEFFGQWMGVYRFRRHNGVDRTRFPEFTDAVRNDMYLQAVEFFAWLVQEDRPLLELFNTDVTFLNSEIARFYRIQPPQQLCEQWTMVRLPRERHRGGVLGLGAVLTLTSAPLRTSPVKRGDWITRQLLGTPVPPPPPDAGSISPDESPGDSQTIRERLRAHRNKTACRACHERIDPPGFALENFDPVGRWRTTYQNGRAIDASGRLRDGTILDGPQQLKEFLTRNRELFYATLSRRLVGYAFGRTAGIQDGLLLQRLQQHLEQGRGMHTLLKEIVCSPQFRALRRDFGAATSSTKDIP